MSDVTPVKRNVQLEEVQFRSAVSESVGQKLGGAINFINDKQYDSAIFRLDGVYDIVASPQLAVDGLWIVPPGINIEIFGVAIYNLVAGSSGTVELDLKVTTASGGSFTSIFSTTPKITSAAGNYAYVQTGGSGTGLTAPILTTTPYPLASGSALRLDKIAVQTAGENCGLIVFYRPTN